MSTPQRLLIVAVACTGDGACSPSRTPEHVIETKPADGDDSAPPDPDAANADTEITPADPEASDAVETFDGTIHPPGSYEACAALYRGFETCCVYDRESDTWAFEDKPCYQAYQCVADEDCPPGFVETTDDEQCLCRSQAMHPDDDCGMRAPSLDGTCPEGEHKCPLVWPPDGQARCTRCACPNAVWGMPLSGTYVCPEDEQRPGCPCFLDGGPCCLRLGEGLACSQGIYRFFSDCPCGPPDFGCHEPVAPMCIGIRPQ